MTDAAARVPANKGGHSSDPRILTPERAAELYQPRDEPVPVTVYLRPDGTPYIKVTQA
jgi:hypothetical protein